MSLCGSSTQLSTRVSAAAVANEETRSMAFPLSPAEGIVPHPGGWQFQKQRSSGCSGELAKLLLDLREGVRSKAGFGKEVKVEDA